MKKQSKTFKNIPVHKDPEAPPGTLFFLHNNYKNLPPRRSGQLTNVDEDVDVSNIGFGNIFYKGKPVEPDNSSKVEYMVFAHNRLHRWWLTKIKRIPESKVFNVRDLKWKDIKFNVDVEESIPSQGRVTKVTSPPEYDPTPKPKRGGRVTKAMPRQLRGIKEGQEASDET